MDWTQIWTILGVSGGLFISAIGIIVSIFITLKGDIKDIKTEAAADRRDILQLIRCIQEEIKDFHGRLCTLEERKRNSGK